MFYVLALCPCHEFMYTAHQVRANHVSLTEHKGFYISAQAPPLVAGMIGS